MQVAIRVRLALALAPQTGHDIHDGLLKRVTLLFQRYARDGKMTRAKAEFSYAHPAFWAPYALYGDPGR